MPFLFAALPLLGFGAQGPILGGLAAYFQAAFGTNFIFAMLQSAAMGGWGVAYLAAIQNMIAAGVAIPVIANWVRERYANETTGIEN
ncbi:hypothetical protein MBLNU457_g1044t1 [Dothideomycetes sp. NU457]